MDAFYMLSRRCDVTLDRYEFRDPAELLEMARDLLDSFARIHAAGVLHADVKLDHMVFCASHSAAPSRRFKLIDWGGSVTAARLRRLYLGSREPKNTTSPMAWYAWGLGPQLTVKAFALMHARQFARTLLTSLEFARFCEGSLASFTLAIERMEAEHGSPSPSERRRAGLLPAERAVRRAIMDEHSPSFDLYCLGLTLAHRAVSTHAGTADPGVHARVMGLARALTHYGDAGFLGDDAAEARRVHLG